MARIDAAPSVGSSRPGRITSLRQHLARVAGPWAGGHFHGYLLLAVVATWPLACQLGDSLVLGSETAATVPLFTTWTVWWNADRAAQGLVGYWDAPIFHPAADVFAFSEPIVPSLAVAPLLWISNNRLLAHNSFLLLTLALNGWTGFHLLRCLGVARLVATLGGGLIVLLPMVQNELGVLQLIPVWGILGTFLCLLRFRQRPTAFRAAGLGGMMALVYLTCANYGLFQSVLLLVAAPWLLGKRLTERRTWLGLAIAVVVSLLLAAPVIAVQRRVVNEHGLVRSGELVKRLSAQPADYLVLPQPPIWEPAISHLRRQQPHFPLCPGFVIYGLALVGAGCGLARRRYRRWAMFSLTLLAVALLLSLGPGFELAGWSPYASLTDWYPGFAQVRSPFRLAIFVQLITVLMASIGLDGVGRWVRKVRGGGAALAALVVVIATSVAAMEILPTRQRLYAPPAFATQRGWIEWLSTRSATDAVVACLPFPAGSHVSHYEQTLLWMYWGTFHQRRLINGYSGFLPEHYVVSKRLMATFPDADSLHRLRAQGVTHCVVLREYRTRAAIEAVAAGGIQLIWQFGDELAEVDVYRLESRPD